MPWADAKAAMGDYMEEEGGYTKLDFELVEVSEDAEEALGLVFSL